MMHREGKPGPPGVGMELGKAPWRSDAAHYGAGQKVLIVRGDVQMHVRVQRR